MKVCNQFIIVNMEEWISCLVGWYLVDQLLKRQHNVLSCCKYIAPTYLKEPKTASQNQSLWNRARSTDLKGWRCGVLIPIPLACQASALPPELHPQQGKITAIMSQILYLIALLLWKIIKLGSSMKITPLSQFLGLILLMNTKHCMVILIIKDSN